MKSWIKNIALNRYPDYVIDDMKREKRITALEQRIVPDAIFLIGIIIVFFGFMFFISCEMSPWVLAGPVVLILFETIIFHNRRMELMFLKTVSLLKRENASSPQMSKPKE